GDDEPGEVEGRDDDHRGPDGGQQVPGHDAAIAGADGLGALDEVLLADAQHLRPDHPGVEDPAAEDQHDQQVPQALPQHGDHDDRQREERERLLDVGVGHEDAVEPAAVVADQQAHHHADDPRPDDCGQADDHRDPGAVEHARVDVTAELVG